MRKKKLFGKTLVSLALIATMTAGQAVPALADSRVPQVMESVVEGAALPEKPTDFSEGTDIDQTDITDPENPGSEQDTDWSDSSNVTDVTDDTVFETDEIEPETEEVAPDAEEPAYDKEEAMKLMAEVISSEDGYISELKIAYDKDETNAKQKLVDAGYKVIDQNLNKDADSLLSRKKAVYLGYKTTTEKKDAIRDIAALGQYDEYVVLDYDEILQNQYSEMSTVESDLITMIGEFRMQYEAGAKTAISAYKLMNTFREDDSELLLGDWLLNVSLEPSSDSEVSPVLKMISEISSTALGCIEYALAMGVSTGENPDNSFSAKLQNMSQADIKKAKADKGLYEKAAIIDASLEDFSKEVEEVRSYPDIPADLSWEELSEEQLEYACEYYTLMGIDMYIYEDETLSEFLCEDPSMKDLYPLASVMTDGQLAALQYIGLWSTLSLDTINFWQSEKIMDATLEAVTEENVKRQMEEIQKIYGGDGITSIYFGVDREVFEGKIAVTKDALNAATSSGDYNKLFGTPGLRDEDALRYLIIGASAVGVIKEISFVLQYSKAAYDARQAVMKELDSIKNYYNYIKDIKEGYENMLLVEDHMIPTYEYNIKTMETEAKRYDKVMKNSQSKINLLSRNARIAGVALTVFGAILVAAAIWEIVDLIDSYKPKYDVNSIPRALFHCRYDEKTGQNTYIRYRCVNDLSDNPGDVNGYVGQAYKILYTTKYVDAGEVLTATIEAQFIAENETSYGKSDDYQPIHKAGYSLATDLNENAFNSKAPKIYVYFKKDC